jgi:methionyl-tRNA formyltransferase
MKIWICAYRDWALEVYESLIFTNYQVELISSKEQFDSKYKEFKEDDVVFFIGWSWILPNDIVSKYNCICLHPSPLPKYRGGSPLQHQIINGEKESAVTFFRMTNKLDAGPILYQQKFSLDGDLININTRIKDLAIEGILNILSQSYKEIIQDESKSTFYRRRKPEESEITISDFQTNSAKQLHDKIRCLQDPYPNAFIICGDGKKLYIQLTKWKK